MSYTPPVGIATATRPGLVQLAGDLGGVGSTANAPVIAGYAKATGGGVETMISADTGTSYQVDLSKANVFNLKATANVTLTFSGAIDKKACSFSLYITQDSSGSRTVSWPGSVKWSGGAPTLSSSPNALDILVFESLDGGTTWYGSLVGTNFGA